MAIRKKNQSTNVGPIDTNTGKPFYTPQQWAALQAQDAAAARAHDEAIQKARVSAHAMEAPKPLTGPSPTGAAMAERNPAGPGSKAPTSVAQLMPAQKPILPTPISRPPTHGRATVAPRTVPASIVPYHSPSAGAAKVAGVVASPNASGVEPAAGAGVHE